MKHFILGISTAGKDTVELINEDYHYLSRVRRVSVGDCFDGVDADGVSVRCTVVSITKSSCVVKVAGTSTIKTPGIDGTGKTGDDAAESKVRITLFQCLPKGAKLDQIIRQATECGVSAIVPVRSRYSIADIPAERLEKRFLRWRKIAREAAQQSGALKPPEILPLAKIDELGAIWKKRSRDGGTGLVFHQERLETSQYLDVLVPETEDIAIVIGPEGGFADEEVELLRKDGLIPIFLGRQTLRSETAALYAIASVQVYLQIVFHVSW